MNEKEIELLENILTADILILAKCLDIEIKLERASIVGIVCCFW